MAKRTAKEFAHVVARLAAAEDARRPTEANDPEPKTRDWDKESARILKSFDDSTDPRHLANLSALLQNLYDAEMARLTRLRQETPAIPKTLWTEIKTDDLAVLANAVYAVNDACFVRNRLISKGLGDRDTKRYRVEAALPEESVSADHIRTGRCPQLLAPRDKQDNFDLQTLLNDLCFRGYLAPGNYIICAS